MALLWINEARNSLSAASKNYAKIQSELDKYNKIFEVYSRANPETQQRAASVMRQAMYEYNWLKKQQEENSIRIFQAQQYINSYNKENGAQVTQQVQPNTSSSTATDWQITNAPSAPLEETIPVVDVATPWVINNNTPTLEVSESAPVVVNTQSSNAPSKIWMTNYYQAPKNLNIRTNTVTKNNWSNITRSNYWPGSVAPMPWTWNMATLNVTPIYNTNRWSNLWNTLNDYLRKWARYIYRMLRK